MKRQKYAHGFGLALSSAMLMGNASAVAAPVTHRQTTDASIACDDLATSAAGGPKALVVKGVANCFADRGQYVSAAERLRAQLKVMDQEGQHGGRAALESQLNKMLEKIATLDIKTSSDAELSVDGQTLGKSEDVHSVFVAAGAHVIEVRNSKGEARKNIEVEAGKTIVVDIPIVPKKVEPVKPVVEKDSGRVSWQVPAMAAGGTVGLAGIVLGVVGLSLANDAEDERLEKLNQFPPGASKCENAQSTDRCREVAGLEDSEKHSKSLAAFGFVLGGLGVVSLTAGIIGRWQSSAVKKNDSGLALTYVPLPGGGGFTLKGAF